MRRVHNLTRTLVASAALVLLVAPAIATAGGQAGAEPSDDHQTTAGVPNLQVKWTEFFNGRKWAELGDLYEEDAILIPPNHEPIQGRAAIIEYLRSVRDAVDGLKCGEPTRVTVSGNLVSLVGECSSYSGLIRYTMHELYQRQADGSWRYRVDMVGTR